jgi:hypothetical protein
MRYGALLSGTNFQTFGEKPNDTAFRVKLCLICRQISTTIRDVTLQQIKSFLVTTLKISNRHSSLLCYCKLEGLTFTDSHKRYDSGPREGMMVWACS